MVGDFTSDGLDIGQEYTFYFSFFPPPPDYGHLGDSDKCRSVEEANLRTSPVAAGFHVLHASALHSEVDLCGRVSPEARRVICPVDAAVGVGV